MTANMETPYTTQDDSAMMPRPSGDFLSRDIRNPVNKNIVVYEDETAEAYIRERRVTMQNGATYKASEVQSKRRMSDVINLRTPAWTTSHNKGHEKLYALESAELGVATVCITPQQNLLKIGKMATTAHDYVEIGVTTAYNNGMDTMHITAGGSSRGGMYTKAIAKVSGMHGAETDYIDSDGAALANGIVFGDMRAALGKLKHEPLSLFQMMLESPEHVPVLANTITTDPVEMAQHAKEIFLLINGSTGRHAAKMPPGTFGFFQDYSHDGLRFENWPTVLAPFPHIRRRTSFGTHLHCVSPDSRVRSVNRLAHVRDGHVSGVVGSVALFETVAINNPVFEGGVDPDVKLPLAS